MNNILIEPVLYYVNNGGKSIRSIFLNILKEKYNINDELIINIKNDIDIIHNLSLVIDDIEDNSEIRRGIISSHKKYGISWSLNASYLALFNILNKYDKKILKKMIENINDLHYGQGLDIYYSEKNIIISEDEYYKICENKTGKMFEIIINMIHFSDENILSNDYNKLIDLCRLFSHYYQIRDDYINLCDINYWKQKGFCEDLDNNKINFLIVTVNKMFSDEMKKIKKLMLVKDNDFKIKILEILDKNDIFEIVFDRINFLKKEMNNIMDLGVIFDKMRIDKFNIENAINYKKPIAYVIK